MKSTVVIGMLLITLVSMQKGNAQTKYRNLEVGGGLSAYIYQGDLTTHRLGSIETTKPGFLFFANYKIKDQLKVQGSFAMGWLKGSDAKYSTPAYRQERNFLFTTPVKDFSLKLQYDLFKNYEEDGNFLFPYISAGVGVSFLNIKKDYIGLTTKLATAEPNILTGLALDDAHGSPKKLFNLPIAIGVRKSYSERLDLFAEANYRFVFSDYLDGFSQSVNPKGKDKYYSVNVGVVYKFLKNNSIKCPKRF